MKAVILEAGRQPTWAGPEGILLSGNPVDGVKEMLEFINEAEVDTLPPCMRLLAEDKDSLSLESSAEYLSSQKAERGKNRNSLRASMAKLKIAESFFRDDDHDTIESPGGSINEDGENELEEGGCDMYLRFCEELQCIRSSTIVRQLDEEELDLKHISLGKQNLVALTRVLTQNKCLQLKSLCLAGNRIDDASGIEMLRAIASNQSLHLESLNLSSNKLGHGTISLLTSSLGLINRKQKLSGSLTSAREHGSVLKVLVIRSNDLSDVDVSTLLTALASNTDLVELDLGENKAADRSSRALSLLLRDNLSLKKLNLSWNRIKGVPYAAMNAIRLKELDLSWNGLGDASPMAIAAIFSDSLVRLKLKYCALEDKVVSDIQESLSTMRSLCSLDLSGNNFTMDGINTLCTAVESRWKGSLIALVLHGNLQPNFALSFSSMAKTSDTESIRDRQRKHHLKMSATKNISDERRLEYLLELCCLENLCFEWMDVVSVMSCFQERENAQVAGLLAAGLKRDCRGLASLSDEEKERSVDIIQDLVSLMACGERPDLEDGKNAEVVDSIILEMVMKCC